MDDFWQELVRRLGRRTLYVDTGAILGAMERGNDRFSDFFKSAAGYRYITSTYVVTETVRRLVKTQTPGKFIGPNGERQKELSMFVLKTWIILHNVHIICLPESQFELARMNYYLKHYEPCDLTDIISFTIVDRLERNEILSDDNHFRRLGLSCLP